MMQLLEYIHCYKTKLLKLLILIPTFRPEGFARLQYVQIFQNILVTSIFLYDVTITL